MNTVVVFLVSLLFAASAWAAPAHVQTTTSSGTSSTPSFTVDAGTGENRILIARIAIAQGGGVGTVNSCEYNSVSLTQVPSASEVDGGGDNLVDIWYLIAPATGSNTFNCSLSPAHNFTIGVSTYSGVHQSTPLGTAVTASDITDPATVAVPSAAGELVVDVVERSSACTFTVGAGQTQRYNTGTPLSAASDEPGASTVTMSWAISEACFWAISAVPLKPAAATIPGRRKPIQL